MNYKITFSANMGNDIKNMQNNAIIKTAVKTIYKKKTKR